MTSIERLRKLSRVDIIDDEREIGNGLIVTLRQGFSFDPMQDNRVAGADNVRELKDLINRASNFVGPYDA